MLMTIPKLLRQLVEPQRSWKLVVFTARTFRKIPGIERVFNRLLFEKLRQYADQVERYVKLHLFDLRVQSGPFKGLAYSTANAHGSSLVPKLLGTYENEIAELFSEEKLQHYSTIVDIGCAEGYYAVGCAVKNTKCRVHAFDTNETARQMCAAMSEANGVSARVSVFEECSISELQSYAGSGALIISDCEGAEDQLFPIGLVNKLVTEDLIIEVHEHLGVDLVEFQSRFAKTHDVSIVPSISDLKRAIATTHVTGNPLFEERVLLLAECRPRQMVWLVAEARTKNQEGY